MPGRIVNALLLGVAAIVFSATFRLWWEGREHFNEATRLLGLGQRQPAVYAFESAAKAYVPGSPYPQRAIAELKILAKSAQMRGEETRAAAIWEVIRRSILCTRHFWQPHLRDLSLAETAVSRLRDKDNTTKLFDVGVLRRPEDPNPLLSVLLFLGLLMWIGGAGFLCLRSVKPEKSGERAGRSGIWVTVGGLGLWLVMCWSIGNF